MIPLGWQMMRLNAYRRHLHRCMIWGWKCKPMYRF